MATPVVAVSVSFIEDLPFQPGGTLEPDAGVRGEKRGPGHIGENDAYWRPRGQRHYSESAVDRVRLIQQLYAAGLSSKVIRELLPRVVNGRATPDLLSGLSAERDRMDEQIGDLMSAGDRLDAVITNAAANWRTGRRCRGGGEDL